MCDNLGQKSFCCSMPLLELVGTLSCVKIPNGAAEDDTVEGIILGIVQKVLARFRYRITVKFKLSISLLDHEFRTSSCFMAGSRTKCLGTTAEVKAI